MFIFLLSGLFCCLGFSGAFFFAVWAGSCFFLCCLGGGADPAQTAKKKTRPRPNSKKKTRPAPSERVVVFAVWAGGRIIFFAVWAGGRVFFFAVWAGVALFFAVWAVDVLFFLVCCLGRGRVFFFAVWAGCVFFFCCSGGGREFTHLPVCLACLQATQQQKRPNSKNKNTGSG